MVRAAKIAFVRDGLIIAEIAVLVAAAGALIYSVILTRRAIAEMRAGPKPSDETVRRRRPY
jgi:hypothetical protein